MALSEKYDRFMNGLDRDHFDLLRTVMFASLPTREWLIEISPWGRSKTDALLKELTNRHLLDVEKQDSNSKGRKPFVYRVARSVGCFIGAEINPAYDRFTVVDPNMAVFHREQRPSSMEKTDPFSALHRNLSGVLESCGASPESVWALGVGIQGLSDADPGFLKELLFHPEEYHSSIQSSVESEFGIPVFITWPKVLLYLKESFDSSLPAKRNFVNVLLDYGTGLGIFVDGKYYEGESGFAGGFGHVVIPNNERLCYCGNTGCLRTLVSFRGICQEALSRLERDSGSPISSALDAQKLRGPYYDEGVEAIIEHAVREQDKLCINLLYDIGATVGAVLAGVVSILNPGLLIIHSNLARAGEIFTSPLRMMIRKQAFTSTLSALAVEFRTIDAYAFSDGGAIHAARELMAAFEQQVREQARV